MSFFYQLKQNALLLSLLFFATFTNATPKLSPGEVGGKAFILLEAESGKALAEYHATERLEPASITKLMTAYVVYQSIENGIISLDDKTVISARARSMGGSRMFLERGSHVSIDDLLSGLVIQSGNDAAVALAEAVAGDEARFVELMNKQAQALGMNDSQFKNVSGLPEQGHYMSAKDIAVLSYAIITDFPNHYKRYSQKSFTWNKITQNNRNALLRTNANVDGLKTGHTDAAGYCLAASGKRGNMRLISVVLGTESVAARVRASQKLLGFGFQHFVNQVLYKKGQQVIKTEIKNGTKDKIGVSVSTPIKLTLSRERPAKGLSVRLALKKTLEAPVKKGDKIGKIIIERDGVLLASVDAISMNNVERIGFFSRLWRSIKGWFS